VKVDREHKTLFYINNLISSEHVHMLCREHGISWRKEVKSVSKQDEKDRTRAELICDILADGHEVPKGRLRHEDLVKIASKYGIATKKTVHKGVTECWVGKPKGMLQIAYERGLLDLES